MPSKHSSSDLEELQTIAERAVERKSYQRSQHVSEQNIRERETEREGRAEYFRLRSHWSVYLFFLLFLSLVFQFGTAILIGAGTLDFTNYKEFLYLVSGENFLQIVGMVFIVVRFLFPTEEDDIPTPRRKRKPNPSPTPPPSDDGEIDFSKMDS